MEKLIGEEKDKEADDFWLEHADYFQSSSEDEEFDSDDDEVEGQKEDSEDSDIDDDESAMIAGDVEAAEEDEKRARKAARKSARSGGYKDPALRQARKITAPGLTRKRTYRDLAPSESLASRREKRQTVAASDMARQERKAKLAKKKKPQQRVYTEPQRRLTQQEMFAEAARTELVNKASLERLLRLEEDKRREIVKSRVIEGPRIKYHSRTVQPDSTDKRESRETITFTDVPQIPTLHAGAFPLARTDQHYPQGRPVKRPTECAVSKQPARYRCPLTGLPYATLAAFKTIRERVKRGEIKPLPGRRLDGGAAGAAGQPAAVKTQ
jgi:vacuolar protein sorting-associated protein 72